MNQEYAIEISRISLLCFHFSVVAGEEEEDEVSLVFLFKPISMKIMMILFW